MNVVEKHVLNNFYEGVDLRFKVKKSRKNRQTDKVEQYITVNYNTSVFQNYLPTFEAYFG